MRLLIVLFFITLSFGVHTSYNHPGGVTKIDLQISDKKSDFDAYYKDKKIFKFYENGKWYGYVGINFDDAIGTSSITIKQKQKLIKTLPFDIKEYQYAQEHITLTKDKAQYVDISENDLKKYNQQKIKIEKSLNTYTKLKISNLEFSSPVKNGKVSQNFGKRRFFNNEPRSPHSGIDIKAPKKTPVYAINSGKVALVLKHYFSGNVIFINHGESLVSMYAHLNSVNVKIGQNVKKGEMIGRVGSTGRATGPHLHFSMYLNANPINPNYFIDFNKENS